MKLFIGITLMLSLMGCSKPCDPYNAGPSHPFSSYTPCDEEEFRQNHKREVEESRKSERDLI